MHYLSARFAFSSPQNFVDVWNRPLVVMLNAGPAWLGGRLCVRFASMLLAIGCGLVAFQIAAHQGARRPVLAMMFTLGQPLLFMHSFSEMTELPFALLLGLAFIAFQTDYLFRASILAACLPLARPEGFGILAHSGDGAALASKIRGGFHPAHPFDPLESGRVVSGRSKQTALAVAAG